MTIANEQYHINQLHNFLSRIMRKLEKYQYNLKSVKNDHDFHVFCNQLRDFEKFAITLTGTSKLECILLKTVKYLQGVESVINSEDHFGVDGLQIEFGQIFIWP